MWRSAARRSSLFRRLLSSSSASPAVVPRACIVNKRGNDILNDPWYNKDTAFPMTERDRLGLRGLLPPQVMCFEEQYERFLNSYRTLENDMRGEPDSKVALAKWKDLNRLHDRNVTLYYRVLIDNIKEFAPIVYTPTVGLVCENYSSLFRRPRGMYFSAKDKGEMMPMIYNWPADKVDMIVVTDGSRILGLGDLGVQGIGIPIGKLDLYVAAAGINPQKVLPVMLDVGTNNEKLLEDKLYLGLRQPRLEGEEYLAIVDEFMEAIRARWPRAVIQFEDFQRKWAFKTLERYRDRFCMFNHDIQGTAGVVLAGLLGTFRAQGRPLQDFTNQKIVVVGAGSAGIGFLSMAKQAMYRMLGIHRTGEGHNQFWVLDKDGLITRAREGLDPAVAPFARGDGPDEILDLHEGASLVEVVKKVKPHVLLGLCGVGGIFNEEVLKAMKESDSPHPAVFAMSNPTTKAECTPDDVFKHVGENAIFASGSPFSNVSIGNGKTGYANQANNMYLFPGIGLGALLSGARNISDGMLEAAAECLASYMTDDEIKKGILFPPVSRSVQQSFVPLLLKTCMPPCSLGLSAQRYGLFLLTEYYSISKNLQNLQNLPAKRTGLAEGCDDVGPKELASMSELETVDYVARKMWYPVYSPLVRTVTS